MANRFPKRYPNGFSLSLRPEYLDLPLHWRQPRIVFVDSMSDLFHDQVPDDYILKVFDIMQRTPRHTFQILTKRSGRLAQLAPRLPWPRNVWAGVTVENDQFNTRIDHLREVPAHVCFVSAEPLIGSLGSVNLAGIHWLIAGGESQRGARPAELAWFGELRDQCVSQGVAFVLKQLGGFPNKRGRDDALLDGRRWTERPSGLPERHPGRAWHTTVCRRPAGTSLPRGR
jgi:protein gp37